MNINKITIHIICCMLCFVFFIFMAYPVSAAQDKAANTLVVKHIEFNNLIKEIAKAADAVSKKDITTVEINASAILSSNKENSDWDAIRKLDETFPKITNLKLSGTGMETMPFSALSESRSNYISEIRWLRNLSLKDVITINEKAFKNCINLETISFGKSLKTIKAYAFANCDKLEFIDLPKSLESIGEYAFSNCDEVKTVRFLGKPPKCELQVFSPSAKIALLVPSGMKKDYEKTAIQNGFYWIKYSTESKYVGYRTEWESIEEKFDYEIFEGDYIVRIKYDTSIANILWPQAASEGDAIDLQAGFIKQGYRVEWKVEKPSGIVIKNNRFIMPPEDVIIKANFVE